MQKKTLRQLRRLDADPMMIRLAKDNQHEIAYPNHWGVHVKDTLRDLLIRCRTESIGKSTILRVCIFLPDKVARGILTPLYEVYCDIQGRDYITRILDDHGEEQGWSDGMAENLKMIRSDIASYCWYGACGHAWTARIWQAQEGEKTIQDLLGTQKEGFRGLVEWQKKVKREKIQEKEKREQEPWDRDMALVPRMFPSFYAWMEKECPPHYLFYTYDRHGAKEGYCSHCRRPVPITGPRHNKEGWCTRCGVRATYKATSRIKDLATGWYQAEVIQRISGGIVIRGYQQRQSYWNTDYRTPKKQTDEIERILLMDTGEVKRYYHGLYKNKQYRWIFDKDYTPYYRTPYWSIRHKLYKRNLSALKKTAIARSTLDLWDELPTDVSNYIEIERARPEIEKLVKAGMFRLARGFIKMSYKRDHLLDMRQTELAKMLKIDTARLKRLKAIDGDTGHLEWFQYEKETDTVWPDEMIRDLGENGASIHSFDHVPQMSPVRVWRYLKKQEQICNKDMSHLLTTWQDFINMAKKNKMDVKNDMICCPRDLQAAHQRLVLLAQREGMKKEAEKLEKKWPKVNDVLPRLKKFEYADERYAILAPEDILDIVKEGYALQHCVHSCDFYFDRIQRDESYLFFLRRAGARDIPWYTLEVEPSGNIRQKRTTGDNQGKDLEEAMTFLKKWQKEFTRRLTREEARLGRRSDQARLREYAKLRQDGNKVWHGRLAGQLLADVLEKDFMAAGS